MELVALPRNPVPSGATVGFFKGYDGTELRFARWDATRSPRRGTVCLFGGRTEFIEKYFEVIGSALCQTPIPVQIKLDQEFHI